MKRQWQQLSLAAARAVRCLIARHRWTLGLGLPFVLASYFLPVPELPVLGPSYKDLLIVGATSLWLVGGIALLRRRPVPVDRFMGVLVAVAAAKWFLTAFTRWKSFMPQWAPFTWDDRLLSAESWLHGGQPPAIGLLPLLGSPFPLTVLDRLYDTAFAAMAIVVLWQAWSSDRERARQFMLGFILVWIVLGVLVAAAFSSVGPVMLEQLTGDTTFRPLLQAMREAGRTGTLDAAASLWNWWTTSGVSIISAFPSIHVAMPALYACVARGPLRWLFAAYTLATLLGSFMLGWHYAIDGYAGILGAIGCWWLAGRLTRSAAGQEHTAVAAKGNC